MPAPIRACQCCGRPVETSLDLGRQPTTNRFLTRLDDYEETHPLLLGQCTECGLVQLTVPWSAAVLQPRVDWVSYREPERHLDTLADEIANLPGVTPKAVICGVTVKDDTLLERFRKKDFARVWRIDMRNDLGLEERFAGVETLQEKLTPESAREIARIRGAADVVIIRHVLEHGHDLPRFIEALATLTAPGGYLVVEVPDCTDALAAKDYTTIWEEHSVYFTPDTLSNIVQQAGFRIARELTFSYPVENAMVLILKRDSKPASLRVDQHSLAVWHDFVEDFAPTTQRIRRVITGFAGGRKAALFGAGHLACAFVNYHGLADLFSFVIDDNPHKQGLLMPGSRLPIKQSRDLLQSDVTLALTCFAPENEEKVIAKNADFVARGGRFMSIFPASGRSLLRQTEASA